MVSQPYKDLLAAGAWARNGSNRQTPEELGIDREDGYNVAYEQIGSGKEPERTGFNQRLYEIDSAFIDIASMGVPQWDVALNYSPASDALCFATTPTGLWVTDQNTGPAYGNATDPDTPSQQVWRRY